MTDNEFVFKFLPSILLNKGKEHDRIGGLDKLDIELALVNNGKAYDASRLMVSGDLDFAAIVIHYSLFKYSSVESGCSSIFYAIAVTKINLRPPRSTYYFVLEKKGDETFLHELKLASSFGSDWEGSGLQIRSKNLETPIKVDMTDEEVLSLLYEKVSYLAEGFFHRDGFAIDASEEYKKPSRFDWKKK